MDTKNNSQSGNAVSNECSSNDENNLLFSRENVELYENKIRLCDSDETYGLEMFCYNQCDNKEPEFIKQCRGLVFHGQELVLKAFPYASEYIVGEKKDIPAEKSVRLLEQELKDFSDWEFYEAFEGTLLRLFYFEDKWFLTTHRKLDAFRSSWAPKTPKFGQLFEEALKLHPNINHLKDHKSVLEHFYDTLDPMKQYMFLLLSTGDNRIVCRNEDYSFRVLHVGTLENGKLTTEDDIGLPKPKKLNFLNIDQLIDYTKNVDPFRLLGVVCFGPNNRQIKVINAEYSELASVRGNEASIMFRYLQIRMDKRMRNLLTHLYPHKKDEIEEYENIIDGIVDEIYRAYVQKKIRKKHYPVPKEEYAVIKLCHEWHLQNRRKNKIERGIVIRNLNCQSAISLNRMIKRVKQEQMKKDERLPRSYEGSPALLGSTPVLPSENPVVLKTTPPELKLPPPRLHQ